MENHLPATANGYVAYLDNLRRLGQAAQSTNSAPADPHASRSGVEDWKRETTARFSIHRFGGDRSYIHREKEALTALIRNHVSVLMGALARSAPLPR